MKTMHLHFTVDPSPEVRVRLLSEHGSATYGVDVIIGEVENTVFFKTREARSEWLSRLRAQIEIAQIEMALHAPEPATPDAGPDETLPAAQVAI